MPLSSVGWHALRVLRRACLARSRPSDYLRASHPTLKRDLANSCGFFRGFSSHRLAGRVQEYVRKTILAEKSRMESSYKASHPGSTPPRDDRQDIPPSREPRAHLGLFDAVCIIVGIVIGSTIYRSPNEVMSNVTSPGMGIFAWALGGALSLIGALCYAELASTY